VRMTVLKKKRLEVINLNRELRILDGTGDLALTQIPRNHPSRRPLRKHRIGHAKLSAKACSFSSSSIRVRPNRICIPRT
jgi:hypothetical protein